MNWTRARIRPVVACCAAVCAVLPAGELGGGSMSAEGRSGRVKGDIRELILEGRLIEADAHLEDALQELVRAGESDPDRLTELLDLAVDCRLQAGRGAESGTLEMARRAVALRGPGVAGGLESSGSLINLARVRYARAHASAAHHHYTQLLANRERTLGVESADALATLTTLARAKVELGDWEGALPLLERALAARTKAKAAPDVCLAVTLANLARVHGYLGHEEGREYALRAARIYESLYAQDEARLALALEGLARILEEAGWGDEAYQLVDRALDIWIRTQGRDHLAAGRTALHKAALLRNRGEWSDAGNLYEQALPVIESSPDAESRELASGLAGYADVRLRLGDPVHAERLRARARDISAFDPSSFSPDDVAAQVARARKLAQAGDVEGALELALKAESLRRDALRLTGHTLPEQFALRVSASEMDPLDVALSVADEDLDPIMRRHVVDAIIRSRAVVFDELAVRYRTLCELDRPEIASLFDDFARANSRLARAVVKGSAFPARGVHDPSLDELLRSREEAEAALTARSVVFRKELTRSRAGLDEVLESLPSGDALVGIVRFNAPARDGRSGTAEASYLAFVLRAGSDAPRIARLGPAERIDRRIEAWKRVVLPAKGEDPALAEAKCRDAGDALRRSLWDPIAPLVDHAGRVFWVPDGAIHQVSLASLPAKEGPYLLETGPTFHYLSCERDLVSVDSPLESRGLLAVGGVDFDAVPTGGEESVPHPDEPAPGAIHFRGDHSRCKAFDVVRFEALPGSGAEVAEISALFRAGVAVGLGQETGSDVLQLLGAEAGEEAVKTLAAGRRVIHLATHGFTLAGECRSGEGAHRGIGTLVTEDSPDGPGANPLVLSGLALAGANRRQEASAGEEDGILTAEEIATLDLHGVEWAVLSGCDTGVGGFQAGEGVFGLRRAFSVAGARTLIMSLWPVEDDAALEWMRALYRARYVDHLDTSDAVRRASMRVLTSRRARGQSVHPFYWGGFVGAGDWR